MREVNSIRFADDMIVLTNGAKILQLIVDVMFVIWNEGGRNNATRKQV